MICIYHIADLDGRASGAIVRKKFPNCRLIPMNYDYDFCMENIPKHETVYMVDFSLSLDQMIELNKRCDLFWIDHHKSAIEEIDYRVNIRGLRKIGDAGCELTWSVLFPDKTMPKAIRMLGRYDVWDHKYHCDILPFQYGMGNISNDPDDSIWGVILDDDSYVRSGIYGKILIDGLVICSYVDKENARHSKSNCFVTRMWGYNILVINRSSNSKIFDSVYDKTKHDIMMCFNINRKGYLKVSLYSDNDIDVSEIAKMYGGGGHKGASGFHLNKFSGNVLENQLDPSIFIERMLEHRIENG